MSMFTSTPPSPHGAMDIEKGSMSTKESESTAQWPISMIPKGGPSFDLQGKGLFCVGYSILIYLCGIGISAILVGGVPAAIGHRILRDAHPRNTTFDAATIMSSFVSGIVGSLIITGGFIMLTGIKYVVRWFFPSIFKGPGAPPSRHEPYATTFVVCCVSASLGGAVLRASGHAVIHSGWIIVFSMVGTSVLGGGCLVVGAAALICALGCGWSTSKV